MFLLQGVKVVDNMKDPTQPGVILAPPDPVVVYPERHDLYPKPGLDGTFLGDGLPSG